MKYLKIIAINISLLLSVSISAQHLGIVGGYTLTGLQQSHYGNSGDFSYLYGYHGGPKVELDMVPNSDMYTINIATLFEMRANRYDISWLKPGTSAETFIYYLYVPMDFNYRQTIGKNMKWLVYGGPRLNIGLFGFTNKHYYLATKTQEKYTKPFGSDGSLSPLDYSVGIGTGLELGHFQFMFGYDYPLSNSSKDPDLSQVRQHNFRASIAYSFRKLKK
jgi:hypothetical protein